MFTLLFVLTHVYSYLLMFLIVYLCIPLFTRVYLFTRDYLSYWCLSMFSTPTLHMATPVYSCLPIFIRVYLSLLVHLFTLVTYV